MADLFSTLFNYSGILSVVLTSLLFSWCWIASGFQLRSNVLSDCGSNKCSKIFNPALAIFGTLQVIFTWAVIKRFFVANDYWIIIPPLLAGLLMLGLSIFDNAKHKLIHDRLGYLTFAILFIWALIFGRMLGTANTLVGNVATVIALILPIGTLIAYKKYGLCAIPEIVFIAGVFTWNIFLSYAIFLL